MTFRNPHPPPHLTSMSIQLHQSSTPSLPSPETPVLMQDWHLSRSRYSSGLDLILGEYHTYPVLWDTPAAFRQITRTPESLWIYFADHRCASIQSDRINFDRPAAQAEDRLHFLHLEHQKSFTAAEAMQHPAVWQHLHGLGLRFMDSLDSLEFLEHSQHLAWLSLNDLPRLASCEFLKNCPSLKQLYLEQGFSVFDASWLHPACKLSHLVLGQLQALHFDAYQLPSLRSLTLSGTLPAWQSEVTKLRSLKKLDLFVLDDVGSLEFLLELPELEWLLLYQCGEVKGVSTLEHHPSLRRITIDGPWSA